MYSRVLAKVYSPAIYKVKGKFGKDFLLAEGIDWRNVPGGQEIREVLVQWYSQSR